MNPVDVIGLLVAVGLLAYLLVALLYPEKFQ
jgi:K+-transporting ATPase KdpF subunit